MKTEIILDIIIILIGLYLALFKSYFQEKGKNIATSEDIEILTDKVESVRQKFLEKNANLKAKLDLLTNLQIGHKNDERQALITFHQSISTWIGLLTQTSIPLVDEYDNEEIKNKLSHYNEVYSKVLSAEALLRIYVNDEKLFKLIHTLKIGTLKNLSNHPVDCLINLKYNNLELDALKNEVDLEKKSAKHKEILDNRTEIHRKYSSSMLDGLKINIVLERKYTDYMRDYLKNLSEE